MDDKETIGALTRARANAPTHERGRHSSPSEKQKKHERVVKRNTERNSVVRGLVAVDCVS